MFSERDIDVDDELHDVLEGLVRRRGPAEIPWLTARARHERRDARIDEDAVTRVIDSSTLMVWRPDGTIDHLQRVLDGMVLTQRARAPLSGRSELWVTCSLQPILNLAFSEPLRLVQGGEVFRAPSGDPVLVGPPGWLPAVERFGLVGLRLSNGLLSTEAIDESQLPDLERQQQCRALIAAHYRRERWWSGNEDLETRPGELVRALTLARMEDPSLFREPHPPLDELLYNLLERAVDDHHFRDFAAFQLENNYSFYVTGMPEALHMELQHRARQFGMAFDQYVIAVLGHLAWRTPFAEDMEPWEYFDPYVKSATVTPIAGGSDQDAVALPD
jgi:hypothetical protein